MTKRWIAKTIVAAATPETVTALKNAKQMALSLGVRVFLYQDVAGRPVFRAMRPADAGEHLELIKEFAPPAPTKYEGALPGGT